MAVDRVAIDKATSTKTKTHNRTALGKGTMRIQSNRVLSNTEVLVDILSENRLR